MDLSFSLLNVITIISSEHRSSPSMHRRKTFGHTGKFNWAKKVVFLVIFSCWQILMNNFHCVRRRPGTISAVIQSTNKLSQDTTLVGLGMAVYVYMQKILIKSHFYEIFYFFNLRSNWLVAWNETNLFRIGVWRVSHFQKLINITGKVINISFHIPVWRN